MSYVNFSTVVQVLKRHLQPGVTMQELMCSLFDDYLYDGDLLLSAAQVSQWSTGRRPVPLPYLRYYQAPRGGLHLEQALMAQVLPYVWDTDRLAEALEALITGDERIPKAMKAIFLQELRSDARLETTLAKLLVYAMMQR